ncbi:hypothetical protein F383_37629 [Gossypium arboreum]|uniref:Uncharacterized protein n=1 Tax=Gossypium arboreum TaxID=29729 RepID=A0A0B0MFP0_GOSAR|nr:hypothetical protein F383_37629 [Gossypium arboreum]
MISLIHNIWPNILFIYTYIFICIIDNLYHISNSQLTLFSNRQFNNHIHNHFSSITHSIITYHCPLNHSKLNRILG